MAIVLQSYLKKCSLSVAIAATALTISSTSQASLPAQMDSVFNSMTNVTSPGVHEGQRRGVITGGRITTKFPIVNQDIMSFSPPSWKAGCGGVDMFMGSFSMINSDQIVELFRAVAANASGYAFKLALSNVFPDAETLIADLQDKIQKMNQYLGNSCQLAQGLVDGGLDSINTMMDNKMQTAATQGGTQEASFDAYTRKDGLDLYSDIQTNNPSQFQDIVGNVLWKELEKHQVGDWFSFGNDDQEMKEAIMSLTGSVIVDAPSEANTEIKSLPGNQLRLNDLIFGGDIRMYSCASDPDNCMMSGGTEYQTLNDFEGLYEKIIDEIIGSNGSPGVIDKYAFSSGTITSAERNLLGMLPMGAGGMIRELSVKSPYLAEEFTRRTAAAMTIAIVQDMTRQMFEAGRAALGTSNNAYANQARIEMSASRDALNQEYATLIDQHGSITDIMPLYQGLLEAQRSSQYILQNGAPSQGGR